MRSPNLVVSPLSLPLLVFLWGCGSAAIRADAGGGNGGADAGTMTGSGGGQGTGGQPTGGTSGLGGGGTGGAGAGAGGKGVGGLGAGGGGTGLGGRGAGGTGSGGNPGCVCPANYAPVCGVNGKTYGNDCGARCEGVAVAYTGECVAPDAGADAKTDAAAARGFCNTDSDCAFRPTNGCCGACLATGDMPLPPTGGCPGSCPTRPGGCSCVNHVCSNGVLKASDACLEQQDACGAGLKCCRLCSGVAPVDGGGGCGSPVCSSAIAVSGDSTTCLQPP